MRATCRPGLETCFAPEYAAVNYILKQLSEHDFVGFRSDLLNDKKGQRTGVNTKYTENTLMLSHWIGTTVQIRRRFASITHGIGNHMTGELERASLPSPAT